MGGDLARTLCEGGGSMTTTLTPRPNRPKRPNPAPVVAMRRFSKRPTRTHYGHIGNGIIPAVGAGFGHFGRFKGGIGHDAQP
jgi:hypothetical protein